MSQSLKSRFCEYWNTLKNMQPAEYLKRLEKNRDRVRRWRHSIYKDPIKHAIYKKKQRAYRKRKAIEAKA